MEFLPILLLGLGLSADCFAVALGCGMSVKGLTGKQIVRTPFSFGAFQFGMPVLGWLAGRTIVNIVSQFDHWVAFALLMVVGGRMIWESFHEESEVADIVELHGGQIWVKSKIGEGSTFGFSIPITAPTTLHDGIFSSEC